MKTIALFGGYGFIGTNLLHYVDSRLKGLYRVVVFDRVSAHPAGYRFDCVSASYAGDFGNTQDVEQVFAENTIDIVFHFLSSTVPATSSDYRFDIESNLVGTVNLLGVMARRGVSKIIYLSSGGAVYGDASHSAHCETDYEQPRSSYGIVKLAVEKYLHLYSITSNLEYLVLRVSNPYGPFHYSMKQGLINIALRKACAGESITVWGDGTNRKDYIFIRDVMEILFKLLETGLNGQVVNLGSGTTLSINEILDEVTFHFPGVMKTRAPARSFDTLNFSLDISRLHDLIGNFEFTPINEGVRETLKWILSDAQRENIVRGPQ